MGTLAQLYEYKEGKFEDESEYAVKEFFKIIIEMAPSKDEIRDGKINNPELRGSLTLIEKFITFGLKKIWGK